MGDTKGLSDEEVKELCHQQEPETKDYIMQQTMYRIKDPRKSLPFYTKVLGMSLLQKLDFPEMKFSLYFMGYESDLPPPETSVKDRAAWTFSRKATIELTHNWGTENDPDCKYHSGNENPRGFGHIGLCVPNVEAACARFEKLGVPFKKKLTDGKMNHVAFILDPDGYWIEIFSAAGVAGMIYGDKPKQ